MTGVLQPALSRPSSRRSDAGSYASLPRFTVSCSFVTSAFDDRSGRILPLCAGLCSSCSCGRPFSDSRVSSFSLSSPSSETSEHIEGLDSPTTLLPRRLISIVKVRTGDFMGVVLTLGQKAGDSTFDLRRTSRCCRRPFDPAWRSNRRLLIYAVVGSLRFGFG